MKLECETCETEICTSSLANLNHLDEVSEHLWYGESCKGCNKAYTAVERIGNLSELARAFYLLKMFGKSTKKLEEELADFGIWRFQENINKYQQNKQCLNVDASSVEFVLIS